MPKASKAEHERKRLIVAKGKVAGKKRPAIAQEANCSESQVTKIEREPATQLLVADLMRPHHRAIEKLAAKAVKAVERGLEAKTANGRHIHEIQLRAVGRFAELAHLAQGADKVSDNDSGLITWQQFVLIYNQREAHAAPAE